MPSQGRNDPCSCGSGKKYGQSVPGPLLLGRTRYSVTVPLPSGSERGGV